MTTEPLLTPQLKLFAETRVPTVSETWRMVAEARRMRSEQIVKSIKLLGAWLRTHVVEPLLWAAEAERSYNELMALDDRTLEDIGIRREEIPQVVARGIAQKRLAAYAAGASQEPALPFARPVKATATTPAPERKLAA